MKSQRFDDTFRERKLREHLLSNIVIPSSDDDLYVTARGGWQLSLLTGEKYWNKIEKIALELKKSVSRSAAMDRDRVRVYADKLRLSSSKKIATM